MKLLLLCVFGLLALKPTSVLAQDPVTVGVSRENIDVEESDGTVEVCVDVRSNNVNGRTFVVGYLTGPFEVTSALASPADYSNVSGTLTFTDSLQQCVTLSIVADSDPEPTESFGFLIYNRENNLELMEDPRTSVVSILGTIAPVIIAFHLDSYSTTETEGSVRFCVEVRNGSPLLRSYAFTAFTVNGTALAGEDFSPISVVLAFDSFSDQQLICIDITIVSDSIVEGSELFSVSLSSTDPDLSLDPSLVNVGIADSVVPNPCLSNPCDVNANCTRTGLMAEFTCTCQAGFIGDGSTCMRMTGGADPHFSIVLPSGELLCFTVQGEKGFVFNLVSNKKVNINALFVSDSEREEVTWMGSLGIIVQGEGYKGSNKTSLRFDAKTKEVHVADKVSLSADGIESLYFKNRKLVISERDIGKEYDDQHPSVCVDLEDIGLHFHVTFFGEHLDIYWNSVTGEQEGNTHGLIGQFFRKNVMIDKLRKFIVLPNKEPVPVMRRPVWSFMEREIKGDNMCWTAMNPGYQGVGLIEGSYLDYLVNDVLDDGFIFNAKTS